MSRSKIREILFRCDFCPREGYATNDNELPQHWLMFEGAEGMMDVCYGCSDAMSQIFVRPGLVDNILLQIRLGNLGYDAHWRTISPAYDAPDICPHCLSIKESSLLFKIVHRIANLLHYTIEGG